MLISNKLIVALCAAVTLLLSAPVAQAQNLSGEVRATASVNVRNGPGASFSVVDTLQTNQVVNVRQCQSGWCYVEKAGPDGWVSARYLAPLSGGGSVGGPVPPPPPGSGGPIAPPVSGNFTDEAQATLSLNVRSGPGTSYSPIATLARGERVELGECRNNWCLIRMANGRTGWASERYLARPVDGGGQAGPDAGFTISGPNFSFTIGAGADFGTRPVRPEDRGRACFYENPNYGGRSLCARPGDSYSQLGSLDNVISSISIEGDIEVQVCENSDFSGRCAILTTSQPRLTGAINDIISSFRVR